MDLHRRGQEQASNGVRHRSKRETSTHNDSSTNIDTDKRRQIRNYELLSTRYLFSLIGLYFILYYVHVTLESKLPKPLLIKDRDDNLDRFIAERAMNNLIQLTDIGPRVAASYENEVLAVKLLTKEINDIIKITKPIHKIEYDVQKVSGSYPLTFLEGLTNYYRNVQNVVVKFGPKPYSKHSMMLNCHFDTVSDSPGGSDDGASCAIMLEILRVLATSNIGIKNNIIFLFNGAEENLMHASHGFITQHKWAKEVGAFINLEACGAGGREVLFQSGPDSPWLMTAYSDNVLYPYASSVAQEVFQSGIVPGDTDFRVFRDFGNVSGLDFAWSSNGYVYHTKYDNVDQIPLGTLQRTGDNILAVSRAMVNAHELQDVQKHKPGNVVYFDLLGAVVVSWPDWFGTILNTITCVLSFYVLYDNKTNAQYVGISSTDYNKELLRTLFLVVGSCLCNLLVVTVISGFLSTIGRAMSWYAAPVWIFFLYVLPSIITPMSIQLYYSQKQTSVMKSPKYLYQLYHDSFQITWTCLLMFTVFAGIRSGYVPWLWVICPVVGTLIQRHVFKKVKLGSRVWLLLHILMFFLPAMQSINMIEGCLSLFIPIMGRIGRSKNSEMIIAWFAACMFGLLFTYTTSVILLVKKPKKLLSGLVGAFLVALLLLIFTPLGFPYTSSTVHPRPQRYMILHTERTFHDKSGEVVNQESGYWIVDHDYNSPHSVQSSVPEMKEARPISGDCDKYLYCGLPYLMPIVGLIRETHWIPTPPPSIPQHTTMNVILKQAINDTITRLTLEITGPDHMGLIISPRPVVQFHKWNLNNDQPVRGTTWNGQETWFIYYACHDDPVPWIVTIDFKVPSRYNGSLIDIALTSHFLHGASQHNLAFKKFLAQFPSWTVPVGWTATYKSWIL